MKVRFTFKTPDVVEDGITSFLSRYGNRISEEDLSHDDVDSILDEKEQEIQAEAQAWFKYSELVTIELDTEAHTATVIKPQQ